jgi:glycosyltransferase involved in cell wall biosynthesis
MMQNIEFKRADLISPVSKDTEDYFKNASSLLDNKTVIIPPGVSKAFHPMDKNSLREKYKIKEKHVVVYVGRIDPEKNVDLIAEKLKDEDICLLIVGTGSEQHKIESLANDYENIRYLGKVQNEHLAEIYNLGDALVMLSEYEGMPTVVLESLSCGVPVVTTDVGDVSKAIKDGITGYIATKENFKEKVLKLLNESKNYKEDCLKMSKEYSWENVANKLYDSYKNIK